MITSTKRTILSVEREDIPFTDKDIIQRYLGISKFPCSLQSPIREGDSRPSFSMKEMDGVIFWKDFATGETGNAVTLMSKIWHVSYSDALLKIKLDTDHRIPRATLIRRYNGKLHVTSDSTIKVKVREWKDWDKKFWKSFGIPTEFASWCNVFPISHAFFTRVDENGKKHTVTVPMDQYAYAYFEWKDGKESIKLYQPYSQTMKWLSKHDSSVWDLWKHAFLFAKKKSDKEVIITSSRKDAMCLWYNLKVPCMSLQGEGYIPKPQVMQEVLNTFKTVYIWYDNDFKHWTDNPGQDNAMKIIQEYPSIINICIPDSYQSKDPSDLVKNHGVQALKEIWKQNRKRND